MFMVLVAPVLTSIGGADEGAEVRLVMAWISATLFSLVFMSSAACARQMDVLGQSLSSDYLWGTTSI